jgi:hypothetical protein
MEKVYVIKNFKKGIYENVAVVSEGKLSSYTRHLINSFKRKFSQVECHLGDKEIHIYFLDDKKTKTIELKIEEFYTDYFLTVFDSKETINLLYKKFTKKSKSEKIFHSGREAITEYLTKKI